MLCKWMEEHKKRHHIQRHGCPMDVEALFEESPIISLLSLRLDYKYKYKYNF